MRPVLLTLPGGWPLRSYGVLVALAFMVAIAVGVRRAARAGLDAEAVRDLCFWLLVSSLVGARLLYIATNVPDYVAACRAAHGALGECTRALRLWEGGLVFYGGFFAAAVVAWRYTRRRGLDFWRVADVLAPAVALGHVFGRLGCWAAGCCWGRASDGAWGVALGPASVAYQDMVARGALASTATATPPLVPVQLLEAAGELALFALLTWLTPRKRGDGEVVAAYLVGYALLRFAVELGRGDAARRVYGPLSTSQWIAVLVLPAALALWARRRTLARS